MSTLAERIVAALEGEVGVIEAPPGSNRGPRVEAYQAASALGGTGWPWCAALVCWAWQRAGVERELARRLASPSTARMCSVARLEGLECSPRPGAAVVWCGRHVETLVAPMGGDVWRTIGGNTGDAVRHRTRSIAGALVYGPPGLEDAARVIAAGPLYWLEDLGADPRWFGPWKRRGWAERRLAELAGLPGEPVTLVARPDGTFALRVGTPRHYGPWIGPAGQMARDARARPALEARLGRELLRPYRTERMPRAAPAAAEAMGKTT